MNWFEYTEQKRTLLIGVVGLPYLALLAVTIRRYIVSYDSFWHLQTDLVQNWGLDLQHLI